MGVQNGLAHGDGLLRVLLGVVVVGLDVDPVGVLLFDNLLTLDLPGVLVGDGGLGVVPAVVDGIFFRVHAPVLQAGHGQVHQHLAQNLRGALRDHQRTVGHSGVGVPGADHDARILGGLQRVGHTGGVHGGDADGVHALSNGVVDNRYLVRGGGVGGTDVVNGDAPILGILLGAGVRYFKEGVTGQLGDEGNGLARNIRGAGSGSIGGAGLRRGAVGGAGAGRCRRIAGAVAGTQRHDHRKRQKSCKKFLHVSYLQIANFNYIQGR